MRNRFTSPPRGFGLADLVSLPTGGKLADISGDIAKGAVKYYDTLNAINAAKYQSKLYKAQAQGAVAAAKGAGQNAYQVAAVGLPSPTLLLVGGLALAALMIVKR